MKKYSNPDFSDLRELLKEYPASGARGIESMECWSQFFPGLRWKDLKSMPEEDVQTLFEKWWEGVKSDEKERLTQLARYAWLFLQVVEKGLRPGTLIGDLFAVVSRDTSEKERAEALERFMEGRTPVVLEKWMLYQWIIEEQLDEDKSPGRTREEEFRFRVASCLSEVFHILGDRPFAETVVRPEEVVDLVYTKLNSEFMRHLLGPDREKELRRQEYESFIRKEKKIPEPDVVPSSKPDPRELGMELAGIPFQKTLEATPEGSDEEEIREILSASQRPDFARSLEAEFASLLEARTRVWAAGERARLNKRQKELLRDLLDGKTPEEIAERTGRKPGTIRNSISILRSKIKPLLQP